MENLYNAKVSFKGDGSFSFTLPGYGELAVYAGRDIFIKGLTVQAVELLRQLRPLMLEHQLNAKPDGCYRVIDLTTLKVVNKPNFERAYKEPAPQTVADLKASLIKTTGPIVEEEEIKEEPKVEEKKVDESKKEEIPPIEPKETKTTKTTKTGTSKAKTGAKKGSKTKSKKK